MVKKTICHSFHFSIIIRVCLNNSGFELFGVETVAVTAVTDVNLIKNESAIYTYKHASSANRKFD